MKNKLSDEEKIKCLKLYQSTGDNEALSLLILSNQGLIGKIVKKYLNKGIEYDDLCQVGNMGLIRALQLFDYEKYPLAAFSSYAGMAVENKIKMEFRKHNKHSHVLSLEQPLGQDKDGNELKIEDLLGTDAEQLIEDVISEMKIDIVREALQSLTSREQQIILLRYGLADENIKTQDEVAKIFGCSRTLIARQEQKAIMKMRHPRNTRKLKDYIED